MRDNIILCGLPGIGKTEAGKRLAAKIGWQYIDTDACLEKYYETLSGKFITCREIHHQFGEITFRQLENQMLSTLLDLKQSVIGIGGGTLNNQDNIRLLKALGEFVYLKNDTKFIFERLMQKGMPSYLDPQNPFESFEKIAHQRQLIYESVADLQVDTGTLSPNEIATKIIKLKKMQAKK